MRSVKTFPTVVDMCVIALAENGKASHFSCTFEVSRFLEFY
jgi:hypothetical protein